MSFQSENVILLDLDNTLAVSNFEKEYSELIFDTKILESIILAKKNGYKVKIHTSRNMRSFNGDLKKIRKYTLPIIEDWLNKNNIPYDEIIIGKPWCGPEGIYVDDKSLSPYEFKMRIFSQSFIPGITVISSFYNEEKNVLRFWSQLKELDKYINIQEFIFVDNASIDKTYKMLQNIKTNDKRIKILQNCSPSNYSKGLSTCLKEVKTKYTLISHSDCQVNLDASIKSWLENLYESKSIIGKEIHLKKIITSFRTNRSLTATLMTKINNILAYKFLNWEKFIDFNSQPKIIETSLIKDFVCEKGYLFDLSLVDHINKKIQKPNQIKIYDPFPVVVRGRLAGKSSWSGQNLRLFLLIFSYIRYFIKNFYLKK